MALHLSDSKSVDRACDSAAWSDIDFDLVDVLGQNGNFDQFLDLEIHNFGKQEAIADSQAIVLGRGIVRCQVQ